MENINKLKELIHSQFLVFLISLIIFFIAAGFGWEKLHYGFNFIDEGFHMTESWRLTAGDRLLEDKYYHDPLRLYSVFNALIFKLKPNITLLEFRKIQYALTMLALLIFSLAIAKFDQQYCFLPLIFSPFAFLGLMPWGIIPNLNYYTYSHLFLVLYLSFFLFGLCQKHIFTKRLFYFASGLAMWGLSFSLLHASIIILSPILLLIIQKRFTSQTFSFTFIDLCYLLAPFFIFWIIFVAIYQETYILSSIAEIKFRLSASSTYDRLRSFIKMKSSLAFWCTVTSLIYTALSLLVLKKFQRAFSIVCLTVLSLLMLITTMNLFQTYALSMPTWFASLFISFLIIFWFEIIKGYYTSHRYNKHEGLSIILLLPATILSLVMSLFSFNGVWNVMLSSIPITAAISIYILHQTNLKKEPYLLKGLFLVLFFLPFYYSIVWYTVKIPYFDSPPFSSNVVEIKDGFGQGIKTMKKNKEIYKAIRFYTQKYTHRNDYIIAFPDVPMAYIIAKRRPALNSSWSSITFSHPNFYTQEIEIMKRKNRYPKLVFIFPDIFSSMNAYPPPSIATLTKYISKNMMLLKNVRINGEFLMAIYIDRQMAITSD